MAVGREHCGPGSANIAFSIPIYATIALQPLIGELLTKCVIALVKEERPNSQALRQA